MANPKYTIGIIDEERSERHRLMNFFDDSFNVKEIKKFNTTGDLVSLIKSENIDVLAIDYKLKDHNNNFKQNGNLIFKGLSDTLKGFPAFILTNDAKNAQRESKRINSFFIVDKRKTHLATGKEKNEFLKEIKANIKVYKDEINTKLKKLKKLEVLKRKGVLDEEQENEYLEITNDLSKIITGASPIPLKYFSQETNKKLNEIISKTDTLIKKMTKK